MRKVAILALLLASAASGDEPAGCESTQAELAKLAGTWEGYVVEGEGENADRGRSTCG